MKGHSKAASVARPCDLALKGVSKKGSRLMTSPYTASSYPVLDMESGPPPVSNGMGEGSASFSPLLHQDSHCISTRSKSLGTPQIPPSLTCLLATKTAKELTFTCISKKVSPKEVSAWNSASSETPPFQEVSSEGDLGRGGAVMERFGRSLVRPSQDVVEEACVRQSGWGVEGDGFGVRGRRWFRLFCKNILCA